MQTNKLILPVSIILGCIILGGFFYAIQISKQSSIEKQQQINIQQKQMEVDIKQAENKIQENQLQDCLNFAGQEFKRITAISNNVWGTMCQDSVKQGGITQDGCNSGMIESLDEDKAKKEKDIDSCYKRFK